MNRPTSGNKVHRRAESGGHHRQSSSGSGHHRSDSAQSCDLDIQHETKHHRSRSGPYEKNELRHDSSGSQLTSRSSMNETPYPRPTSLFPTSGDSNDSLRLEREPLKFEVNLVGAPPEVEQLVNNIKQVAEQFLYHWKMFPIAGIRGIVRDNLHVRTKTAEEGGDREVRGDPRMHAAAGFGTLSLFNSVKYRTRLTIMG
uniref:Uncharacterized protein n=1 Tax=Photinus pyralis TaxID=7054 RepID=A0A1Y1LP66_PHOPY